LENILDLEMNEFAADAAERVVLLKALNSFSPRSFSFIIFVKGEGFTDSFFGLLDSPGRNIRVL
jgi:hypothetical protein